VIEQHARERRAVEFLTALGWMAVRLDGHLVERVIFGYSSRAALRRALGADAKLIVEAGPRERRLVDRMIDYAAGGKVRFDDIAVRTAATTPFQRRVLAACRAIPFGQTRSYRDLARRAGAPGAARAVGSVMARNACPLIIPCHRVIASDGRIGGFSAPQGVALKRRLLNMEAAALQQG
jgi:methylated-DNA-[protein]-cysteine S-methyltransferase